MRRTLFLLFFTHLFTRLLFVNIVGIYNNYSLQSDSYWLVGFAEEVLKGNFNFDIGRFVASPFFPFVCGFFKMIFHSQWPFYLILFQLILSSISGLYIYKIALLIFRDKKIALFSSLIFAFFPMTMWYVHTFSQESIFQSVLIIGIYFLLASLKYSRKLDTVRAAVLFSCAYLTKSHILIFCLMVPLIYFHYHRFTRITFIHSLIFASILLIFSMPYGIYQYRKNGSYVLSSNGAGYQFYLGNTEAGYRSIVEVPKRGTPDFQKVQDITVTAGYFNGSADHYSSIMNMPQKFKQKEFISEAVMWIKSNPLKFLELKFYDAAFFFMPGVSFRHYDFLNWISTLIVCLPVYLLGYLSIYRNCKINFPENSWILYLVVSMLIFSTVWYVQNRFRTITLEPFYIIYASVYLYHALEKFSFGTGLINFLDIMFLKYLQSIQIRKLFSF